LIRQIHYGSVHIVDDRTDCFSPIILQRNIEPQLLPRTPRVDLLTIMWR